jgi:hypothetical protein
MEESPITVLESVRMDYPQGVLLYQDRPEYGLIMKAILALPAVLLAAGIHYWSTGDASDGTASLTGAVIMAIAYWLVFPREYQVHEDHLRIVLGGPFSVKVGFENLKAVSITGRPSPGINFATRIARTHVQIEKRKGMSIAITPAAAESFVEEANLALSRWTATRSR